MPYISENLIVYSNVTTEEYTHFEDCLGLFANSTIKWKTEEDGRITLEGGFHWRNPKGLGLAEALVAHRPKLPWSFSKVFGHFYMAYGNFESLEGCPDFVERDFYCYNNRLTNLIGGPKYVSEDYLCGENPLVSFEGAPDHIGGRFYYDTLTIEKWNFESKLQVLLEGEQRYSNLISTIISPESIQDIIDADPIAAAIKATYQSYKNGTPFDELGLSVNTVYRHRQDLLDRTKSTNLAGLVIYAIEQGIIYVGVK
jgi:hypothetical protein